MRVHQARTKWFTEATYGDMRLSYRMTKELVREQSKYQEIRVVDTAIYGRMLVLDGIVQLTERDEFVYHEMLVHVPLIAHRDPRDVLIIGGGDGGALREALKHNVRKVTLVEIDSQVVTRCKQFLPMICRGAFDDKRARIVIDDGVTFLKRCDEKFDVVIIDSTDRLGPGRTLYTESFYRNCSNHLRRNGIVVNQNGIPFLFPDHVRLTFRRRRKVFATANAYIAAVPSLPGGFFAYGWSTKGRATGAVSSEVAAMRCKTAKLDTRYYTPDLQRACFALPVFLQRCLN